MGMNQRRLGKYELQERLGPGAVGEVWKALDTQQQRYVAIKIIPVTAQNSADFAPRFYQEAQILATLRHPHIVPILDFSTRQDMREAYIIMDYVEGPSLADYLSETADVGKIPPPAGIVRLLTPIASALDYAHSRNVLHGALKPAAILLDKESAASNSPGEPKLTGFALHHKNPLSLSLSDVSYISPEVAQGFAGTNRSDLYSLGVILYEMCTGALPFPGDSPNDVLMQHIHGTLTSPALINPHLPPALVGAIMRSLARDPASRFSTAMALVTTVAHALNVSVPESSSHARSSLSTGNSSQSRISSSSDMMNNPAYPGQPIQQPSSSNAPSVPSFVAGSNTPVLPPPQVISSSTPVLHMTPMMQTPAQAEMDMPTVLTASSPSADPASKTIPTAPAGPLSPSQTPGRPVPAVPPLPPAPAAQKRRRGWLYIVLVAALLVVLGGSIFSVYLFYIHNTTPAQPTIVGHAFFLSSGFLGSESSNQGITDELQINVQNLPPAQTGKNYYAWLLDDRQNPLPAVALGSLPLNHGQVTLTYRDPQHNNLLYNYGHFLITEESANPQPTAPSLDPNTWRYYAIFSTAISPGAKYSLLDHLRHLLAQDPTLNALGLGGGLDIWLFRNTLGIVESAGSARDTQRICTPANTPNCDFVHRALVRILDYLDGSTYVQTDVPPGTPVLIDKTIARVALLSFDALQQPPAYLVHIAKHLREITSSPGTTAEQRVLAIHIGQIINNVQAWLEAVHADAVKLVNMDDNQLSQPGTASIFNDMFSQATYAFVGQFDPNTGAVKEGVVQIRNNIQKLATFDVTQCTTTNGKNTCS
ncbi:MAG TPA: protein kinase [Ktedonobacteraceae bacterium]|nr:protein kinase [Ktedonobacteraceae bacterium]